MMITFNNDTFGEFRTTYRQDRLGLPSRGWSCLDPDGGHHPKVKATPRSRPVAESQLEPEAVKIQDVERGGR